MQPNRELTPEIVAKELKSQGLPDIFSKIVTNQHRRLCDGKFGSWYSRPSEFYRLLKEWPEDIPYSDTILPLHESNSDFFVCYVPGLNLFIEHSIEWRPEDHRVIARSLSEYLDYEVRKLRDDYGLEPDELRCIGSTLGHPDIDRIVDAYERSG